MANKKKTEKILIPIREKREKKSTSVIMTSIFKGVIEMTNKELTNKYLHYPKGYYKKYLIVDTTTGEILERSVIRENAVATAKSLKFNTAVIEIPPKK